MTSIALLAITLTNTGCKKSDADTTKPVITIVGSNPYYFQVSTTTASYLDQGASANDDVDGALVATPSGTVTSTQLGTYTITYTATDKAGNVATATRTVYVVDIAGAYATVVDDTVPSVGAPFTYADNMTMTSDGKVTVTKFGDYTGGSVHFNLNGPSSLTLPSQTVTCGSPSASRTFSGSGTINSTAPTVVINFTEGIVGAASGNYKETYTR